MSSKVWSIGLQKHTKMIQHHIYIRSADQFTLYWQRADLLLCYPLMCVVITTFLSWKFSKIRALCGHALSSWKKWNLNPLQQTQQGHPLVIRRCLHKCIAKGDGPPQLLISFLSFFSRTPTCLIWSVDLIWIWYFKLY